MFDVHLSRVSKIGLSQTSGNFAPFASLPRFENFFKAREMCKIAKNCQKIAKICKIFAKFSHEIAQKVAQTGNVTHPNEFAGFRSSGQKSCARSARLAGFRFRFRPTRLGLVDGLGASRRLARLRSRPRSGSGSGSGSGVGLWP